MQTATKQLVNACSVLSSTYLNALTTKLFSSIFSVHFLRNLIILSTLQIDNIVFLMEISKLFVVLVGIIIEEQKRILMYEDDFFFLNKRIRKQNFQLGHFWRKVNEHPHVIEKIYSIEQNTVLSEGSKILLWKSKSLTYEVWLICIIQ